MSEQPRPNLLFILSDQHCAQVTGCYGDPLVQTPHLDRLADRGVLFESAYCCSPICLPSRMSLLTGRQPFHNAVWTNEDILDSGIPTFAHAMGAAGYEPVLIGRLHSLGPDQHRGYTRRMVGDHYPNHLGGTGPERGIFDGAQDPERVSLERSGAGQSAYQVHDEAVTAAAVEFLNTHKHDQQTGGTTQPFCLTLGYMLPHPPYVASREDFDRYADSISLPADLRLFDAEPHPFFRWWRETTNTQEVPHAQMLRARAAYWGLVTRLDRMIGEVLDALEQIGLREQTLVVYTSDHGDMLGEHGLWWKHTFYESSVRVPLIVSWPRRIPAGQRSGRVVSLLDVNATMLDAIGAPALPHAEGRSFLKLMDGDAEEPLWDDLAFSEYCQDRFAPPGGCYQRMIRQGDWKLIYYHRQPPMLFNLREDPEECVNRADDPACRLLLDELTARILEAWSPEIIAGRMARRRADNRVLKAWAQQAQPADSIRWQMRPEMSYLSNLPESRDASASR